MPEEEVAMVFGGDLDMPEAHASARALARPSARPYGVLLTQHASSIVGHQAAQVMNGQSSPPRSFPLSHLRSRILRRGGHKAADS